MDNNKEELENLEQVNITFIKSLKDIIEPFVKKLKTIHINNIDLNAEEKKSLENVILLIKHYSEKESDVLKHFKGHNKEYIIRDINCTLAIVMRIATDAEKGKLVLLYSDCEELKADLLKLEEDILSQKKLTA